MTISSYSAIKFSVNQDGKNVSFDANEEQQGILSEMLSCIDEQYLNPEYNVHAVLHSAPQYDGEMGGYAYSELLFEWAKDHPQVKSFRFDDNMFMSSVGFIIPSANKYEKMGLNVVLCPQSGKPFEFFCYPNHLKSLLAAFNAADSEFAQLPDYDNSSPLFKKKQELFEKLLSTVEKDSV